TNNLGRVYATQDFAKKYGSTKGYGMVAYLAIGAGGSPYIARICVYPSLVQGAIGFLERMENLVGPLGEITSEDQFLALLWVKGAIGGPHTPATALQDRATAYDASTLQDGDKQNIADWKTALDASLDRARTALANVEDEPNDPTLENPGPPSATFEERLTPSDQLAPHTLP